MLDLSGDRIFLCSATTIILQNFRLFFNAQTLPNRVESTRRFVNGAFAECQQTKTPNPP